MVLLPDVSGIKNLSRLLMAKPNDTKRSAHYQALEAQFEQRTRRFSPFEVLGLTDEEESSNISTTHTGVGTNHTRVGAHPITTQDTDQTIGKEKNEDRTSDTPLSLAENSIPATAPGSAQTEGDIPTHMSVDNTNSHVGLTHPHIDPSYTHVDIIHSRVVERSNTADPNPTTLVAVHPTHTEDPSTHTGVDTSHTEKLSETSLFEDHAIHEQTGIERSPEVMGSEGDSSLPNQSVERIHDVFVATNLRSQLGQKARQVLAYLNSIRSVENPAYTVSVGYGQIAASADVSSHYLRRDVLPKLAMIGLIGIVHKSFQGTIYHLHYDYDFMRVVSLEEAEAAAAITHKIQEPSLPVVETAKTAAKEYLPAWIDREIWGSIAYETVEQLVKKAGSESLAKEKLAIILYNETHGPEERHVRDRRAVLAHYIRSPQADIWPNDDGYETLALRRARQEHDQALQEKELAEQTLKVRQEAAKARFLTSLDDAQCEWLKLEAKSRVDARPESKFLSSRYPLYKAEEELLINEWMDRVIYGEIVPRLGDADEDSISDDEA
jgi:hypothetical protein